MLPIDTFGEILMMPVRYGFHRYAGYHPDIFYGNTFGEHEQRHESNFQTSILLSVSVLFQAANFHVIEFAIGHIHDSPRCDKGNRSQHGCIMVC